MNSREPSDQAQRDAAVQEREGNVIVDAGAGTGKTTIVVDRVVERVAPADGSEHVPIERIAAITFTRKAAGELRLRIREKLLDQIGRDGVPEERRNRLKEALDGLDTAHIGTIHSFADRLLRLRPVEAELSPGYEIAEDASPLHQETWRVLLSAVERGTLRGLLAGTDVEGLADEATETLLTALRGGLQAETREAGWVTRNGLDSLVSAFALSRDLPPPEVPLPEADFEAFRTAAREMLEFISEAQGDALGTRWLHRLARELEQLLDEENPARILRELVLIEKARPYDMSKGRSYGGDEGSWAAWQVYKGDNRKNKVREGALRDEMLDPMRRWLATRLARTFPVVVELYEQVKARHGVVDQVDLLIKLRDLLRDHRDVRAYYQGLFDHVFVDEFQDTDPLQAEIVLFLCEDGTSAARWEDVVLAPDSLTIVGDPKQSIYRFRRADIAMYDDVRKKVAEGPHVEATLTTNFRSRPELIEWLNDRFEGILGVSPDGSPFDEESGQVYHQALEAGRPSGGGPAVHQLAVEGPRGDPALRLVEAEAQAQYLRWLVGESGFEIEDPLTKEMRAVRYGDVAVLCVATTSVRMLLDAYDEMGIPHAARGGGLFLRDPLHRQFILGLRAIADRDDGVAEAALMRPPFFAVDLGDLVCARAVEGDTDDEAVLRARAVRDAVTELRRERFARPVGDTARALLEETAFGRAVACGPNGEQRLSRLRELCVQLERLAAEEGLDYDGATARMREWIDSPAGIDAPAPVDSTAVQVLTVHQAKGLEFPVVVFWDGRAKWEPPRGGSPWRVERHRKGWTMNLAGLVWEEPVGLALEDSEQSYSRAERRRVVYVAATRARDLFVVPKVGSASDKIICAELVVEDDPSHVFELEPYSKDGGASWASAKPPEPAQLEPVAGEEQALRERWEQALAVSRQPRLVPMGVVTAAHRAPVVEVEVERDAEATRSRVGRFGAAFGRTVHRAIGDVAMGRFASPAEAVAAIAPEESLDEHVDEAAADVDRALGVLRAEGLLDADVVRFEYPVAGSLDDEALLNGYIDFVAVRGDEVVVIDFKTDAPPEGEVGEVYPEYVRQVGLYGALLAAGVERNVRSGLLFTACDEVVWTVHQTSPLPSQGPP